jgi:hypothetical protein
MFPPWAPLTHRSACFMGETSFPHVPPSELLRSRPSGITALAQQVGLRDARPGQGGRNGQRCGNATAANGGSLCSGDCHRRSRGECAGAARVGIGVLGWDLQERQRALRALAVDRSGGGDGEVSRCDVQLLGARVRDLLASRRRRALDPPPVARRCVSTPERPPLGRARSSTTRFLPPARIRRSAPTSRPAARRASRPAV